MSSPLDAARSTTRQQDGQAVVQMLIAVAQTAAVEDQRMIQQRAIAVRRGSQLLQEVRETLGVICIDAN